MSWLLPQAALAAETPSELQARCTIYGFRPQARRVEARPAHREEQYLALLYGPTREYSGHPRHWHFLMVLSPLRSKQSIRCMALSNESHAQPGLSGCCTRSAAGKEELAP